MIRRTFIIALAAGLLGATIGCGASAPEPPAQPAPTAVPVVKAPTVEPGEIKIHSHLATKVLEVGTQRVAFLLNTQKALVKSPQVRISVVRSEDAQEIAQTTADYNAWPYGVRGSYAAPIDFPGPGDYRLSVTPIGDEVSGTGEIEVKVLPETPVPSIGEMAPASMTKVLATGVAITDLTTDYEPDDELYRISVADALETARPTVIVFATPAFCTSPTCGPQVDTVSELRVEHPDAANYIHVELYDNPGEIQGDLSKASLVPAAEEWGFTRIPGWTNESWVFVLDADGIVRQRFEGYATLSELEAALMDAIEGG